jgi:hypothetical protein
MPAAANIVLADAQATPVNHTYIPLGPDPKDQSIFWFEDQSAASTIGYWRLSVGVKRPPPAPAGFTSNAPQRFNRVTLALYQPVLEVVNSSTYSGITPAPNVSYINRVFCELSLPERGVPLDRKNLRKMMSSLLSDASIISTIDNLQNFY